MGQMKTFTELYSQINEFRLVSKAQRRKMKVIAKRNAKNKAIQAKKARSKLKIAPPAKQKIKAAKMAKQFVLDKFYPKYKDMGMEQRVKIDQLIQSKYSGLIAKMTQKNMKKVKAKEIEKVKKARETKQDA